MKKSTEFVLPDRRMADPRQQNLQHINLQLAALGQPICEKTSDPTYLDIADSLLKNYLQHRHLLSDYRCPADQRIQNFLNDYLHENGIEQTITLPGISFILSKEGLAKELSLPVSTNLFRSSHVESYRVQQGVLHNPSNDRRTTKDVFHIVEGGLPIPADKKAVPVAVYTKLLQAALNPPQDLLQLPITSDQELSAELWVSLLLRPIVQPEVKGYSPAKSMETRFFAPGSLVSNLDFIETIFGNGGDPFLPENDSALDIQHWTGHSGCIILAPHLTKLSKQALGLPHIDQATERMRHDGMCWHDQEELYNDGNAFKIVCRDQRGVIVTIIADNYFGYSKKEIKSQISYSANLFGGCEEEHSGGALAFPCFNLGEIYLSQGAEEMRGHTFDRVCQQLASHIDIKPEGYAVDTNFPDIIYIPEDAHIDIQQQSVYWKTNEACQVIKLLASNTYIYPSGFKVHMEKHPHAPSWRLIGTLGEGTFCHKPSTVSGGGKSEISKSIASSIISGPTFVGNFDEDFKQLEDIFNRDFSIRFRDPDKDDHRTLLSSSRTLGSAIKMLTPSVTEYTDEYNQWLESIPHHILALVYMIKRFYNPDWGKDWRRHFSVDSINGNPGHELKYDGRRLVSSYLRVGFQRDNSWRVYKLRQDFVAAGKVQMEDDITASTIVPATKLKGLNTEYNNPCIKIVGNCENRLFQRPDDAIHRGLDIQTEADLSGQNNFISNFQPLTTQDARDIVEDAIHFEAFSLPMKEFIRTASEAEDNSYFVSSAHPRLVDGKPSQNVRYLQLRPDMANPRQSYIANIGTRLARSLSPDQPVHFPVNAVLQGRRNNPPDIKNGIRSLAVYNPIHYQELPELFMDLICSLTGKSPSTTGAGTEGALTKGPFNALSTTADLNTALVSFILCDYAGYSTAAGYIGTERRIDHDISMLVPEIWCRLPVEQREPEYLISNGFLEKLDDFDYDGKTVLASRLGFRITEKFAHTFLGKIFDNPIAVFDEAMLRPETQDIAAFADGILNITEAQKNVAQAYFEDGSIKDACPPLHALLHIMAHGDFQGKTIEDSELRDMFTRQNLLASDWYQERLLIKQARDVQLWQSNYQYLQTKLDELPTVDIDKRSVLETRLKESKRMIDNITSQGYLEHLQGTLGADWVHRGI